MGAVTDGSTTLTEVIIRVRWNQLPHRLSKSQSLLTTAVLFRLFTPGRSDHMILWVQTAHCTVEYMVNKISHEPLAYFLSFKKFQHFTRLQISERSRSLRVNGAEKRARMSVN